MAVRVKSDLPESLEALIHEVIGAAIEVHRILGPGFLESIYEQAMCHELTLRGIQYERQKSIAVEFKGEELKGQRIDLLVEGQLLLELKAVESIPPVQQAKLMSYMKTMGVRAGLMINFHVMLLKDGLTRVVL